jgi:hypothetical protein
MRDKEDKIRLSESWAKNVRKHREGPPTLMIKNTVISPL